MRIRTGYQARPQFYDLHTRKARWAVAVCHRRAGKTVACVNDLLDAALRCTKNEGRFAYVAPTYGQAKDVAWSYLRQFTAPIPGVSAHETELRVDLPNGARIRLYGADNYDRLRGIYLDGLVCDEFGDMDPRAWSEVLRPALSDRQGWAIFIGTPKGSNHFRTMWDQAQDDPNWFRLMLKASETGILPPEELDDARKMMTPEQFAAEYECSFQAAILGAYFGKEIEAAENDHRITSVPHDPAVPVHTAWDLGIGDTTAIWLFQQVGTAVHIIDHIEASGVGLDWYVRELDKRPYRWGEHILPHDANARELGTGRTRLETLQSLGLSSAKVLGAQSVEDGINAARLVLPRCWFDKDKTKRGIDALKNYRSEWDEKNRVLKPRPVHDWASHSADAFRYLALGLPSGGWGALTKQIASPWKVRDGGERIFV